MPKGKKHKRNERGILILAKNIRRYRESKGITIEQLANEIDVDYSQISRIERALVNTNISIVFDIAAFLGIKPSQLLEED
ncbi:helix-turn-helix domain-containing protein [Sphingobacterium paludis]|uniref:Helix-turn-helix protein n=1 Tax=Sphingobacterium paludis TaxID=1476465 RepID=A0A4R7D567_9SPHI|nr:helix-turn-helix transcriptional regulator [Sphingobacterium paludis]TDS14824.1 helix-turn-helix protein [Sphingobacterium paludis]